jgi:hypothetical protein
MEKTRQELFELVWSMPMTKLSKQFELSDVGLRKICVKHQLPLPPQGHWTRKQFGKEGPRPELPNKEINPRIEINNEYKTQLNRERSDAKKTVKKFALSPPTTEVRKPDQLKHERCIIAYEEIKEFIIEIEKIQTVVKFDSIKDKPPSFPPTHIFAFSYFRASRKGFPLYATARNAIRAVCIADEIFERLEEKGIEIHFEFHDRTGSTMHAVKNGEKLQFQFREPYTKVSRTPALSKIEKQLHKYAWDSNQIEVPQNVLCINFGWSSYTKKVFKDSGLKLEQQIEIVVGYVVKKLDEEIEDTKQRKIRQSEYERKKHIYEFNESIAQDQKRQLGLALKESKELASLVRLKVYLKTMKEIFSKLPEDERAAGTAWIAIVKKQLRTIQPIETRIRRIKRAAKKPKKKIKELWYADLLPQDHDPDFEEEYAQELENGLY